MLFDTHCHLNLQDYQPDESSVIMSDCLEKGIWMANIGTDFQSSLEAVDLAKKYDKGVYATIGSHPDNFLPGGGEPEFNYEKYKELAVEGGEKIVGMGECGLDYFRLPEGMSENEAHQLQEPDFVAQIRLAKEFNKAVVVHCRPAKDSMRACEDALEILKREAPERFVMHSFTSPWEICKKFVELGAYVSINGIITFDKTGGIADLLKNIPDDKLLFETDAPFLAPVPFRGKKNQPQYVAYVASAAAAIIGQNPDKLNDLVFSNSLKLYGLKI